MRHYNGFTPPQWETIEGMLHVKPMFRRGKRRPPNCYVTSGDLLLALRGKVAESLDPERDGQIVRIQGQVCRHRGSPDTHAIMGDIDAIDEIDG